MSDRVMLTCALPLYKSADIAWLALESLCRQEGADFDWELVVCEEVRERHFSIHKMAQVLGEDALRGYEPRLKAAGCKRIKYVPLDDWIPLSNKWVKIAERSSSNFFLLVAADCYSQPLRLRETVDIFLSDKKPDWVQSPLGAFYDIITGYTSIYDQSLHEYPTGLNMAIKTPIAKALKPEGKRKGVDGWMFSGAARHLDRSPVVGWNESEHWERGIDTHGYNQISRGRRKYIGTELEAPKPPFRRPNEGEGASVHNYIPADICDRVLSLSTERPFPADPGTRPRGVFAASRLTK